MATGRGGPSDMDSLMTRLARHRALGGVPTPEHAWLAAHGRLRTFAAGEVLLPKGEGAHSLYIVFTGHLAIRVDRGAGSHKIMEWGAGDVSGLLPFSRGTSAPNDVVAETDTEHLEVPEAHFPEMIRECPATTAVLVHAMLDRARRFTSQDLRDEKLIALGKLAAGLAHELNNPASALARSAKLLAAGIEASEAAARRLGAAGLSDAQIAAIDEVRALCRGAPPTAALTAIGRADREDEIAEWLARHHADDRGASPLAETGVTIGALDGLARAVGADALDAAVQWLASGCNVRTLAAQIEAAASRINGLVGAVKGFTYMDRAPDPEPVDIRRGIADTLTMLGAKRRAKAVDVVLALPEDLPCAHAVGAELNQVWMNLLDNALDAVGPNGRVTVSAAVDGGRLVVRITDNGAGIPPDVLPQIFDPFFTTKPVGQGTGLGLDIVRRLLQRHDGEIAVESAPGRTEFQVRVPME